MLDRLDNYRQPDPVSYINVHDEDALFHWTDKFIISAEELTRAVHFVGPCEVDVRRFLSKW